jgi:hypothetical protein
MGIMNVKKKLEDKITDAQRIEFAKHVEALYESSYADMKKVVTFAFIRGIATGVGVFIGGTIVVSLVLWLLSLATELPFVGDISKSAENSIHQTKP